MQEIKEITTLLQFRENKKTTKNKTLNKIIKMYLKLTILNKSNIFVSGNKNKLGR
jgi:hypothetical protein